MKNRDKIKDFLSRNPEFINRTGKEIADEVGVYNIAMINKIKKSMKSRAPKKVIKTDDFSPELLAKAAEFLQSQKIDCSINYNEPKKIVKKKRDLTLPSIKDQVGMHIVLGCVHAPFEHKRLMKGIRNLIKDNSENISGFHLIGDFMDLNSLSSHDKGRFLAIPGINLDSEYESGNELLDSFDEVLPGTIWKTYLYGNHEDRYKRYMKNMDNAKTPLVSPTEALNLWNRGYQVKENWSADYFTLGKHLDIFHGIYFNVHSAKKHMDAFRGSCMYAHTHRTQTYIEGNTASFNIGACADFTSPAFGYATRGMKSQWSNGFAIVMIDEDGSFNTTTVHVKPDGTFYFGGKKY